MGINNNEEKGYTMPTTIPFKLPDQEPELVFNIQQSGIGRILHIPYVFSFPYFSGSLPKLTVEIANHSGTNKVIKVTGRLYLLLPRRNMQERYEDQKGVSNCEITINAGQKAKGTLNFVHLQQPGNYTIRLDCSENQNRLIENKDVMYFDALPKDGSTFNIVIIVISALIGFIAGLISGGLIN